MVWGAMKLIANSINGAWPRDLLTRARIQGVKRIDVAVAYITDMDGIFDLAEEMGARLDVYALADGRFPSIRVMRRLVEGRHPSWRLFLTRDFYHPKIVWLRGVGAYIGSANLTDKAWNRNIECGVWFEQADLIEQHWTEELADIFDAIKERCQEATADDLKSFVDLKEARADLIRAQQGFDAQVDASLSSLLGKHSPVDHTRGRLSRGDKARQSFLTDWSAGLTILKKLARRFADERHRWPAWVDRTVPSSIVQDQATEWWWDAHFRRTGQSRLEMARSHARNSTDPDGAVERLIGGWCDFEPSSESWDWRENMNVAPAKLRGLLTPPSLQTLTVERLEEILFLCHAAREHGRQIRNVTVGLAKGTQMSIDERVKLFASLLIEAPARRSVSTVLLYALWGDDRRYGDGGSPAERIWTATSDEDWKLPHLGRRILGELIGYARPDEYPPRNNRVSKTLYALGFDKIKYD